MQILTKDYWKSYIDKIKSFFKLAPQEYLHIAEEAFCEKIYHKTDPLTIELIECLYSKNLQYRNTAYHNLFKNKYSNIHMREIVMFAPSPYKKEAWENFLLTNYSIYDLYMIIIKNSLYKEQECPYKRKAWKLLLKQNKTWHLKNTLENIQKFGSAEYKNLAIKELKKYPSYRD